MLALLAGCGREQIRVYRVPKEKPKAQAASARRERPPPHELEWKLPKGWSEQAPGQMSVASFAVTGSGGQSASITAMPFPGLIDQDLLVVNILRETAKLPPITEADLAEHTQQIAIGHATGRLFQMTDDSAPGSTSSSSLMIAMVTLDNVSWFFRISGDTPVVREQQPAFLEFLRTLTFHPPADDPSAARTAPAMTESGRPRKPAWTVPASWKEVPPTTMLLAKFLVSDDAGAKAEITVAAFPGSAGGLLTNVNRWRGQIGLAPVAESELNSMVTSLEHPEGQAQLVDMTGTDAKTGRKTRLIAVIMPQSQETWYYKLLGDERVAAREKAAFVRFVQTVDYDAGTDR